MRSSRLKQILLCRLPWVLLVVWIPPEAHAQTKGWKTYTDTVHGYAFNYPPGYEIDSSAVGLSLKHGDTSTWFYIEDWTRSVRRGETQWDLPKVASERALTACMADGPHCSVSCKLQSSEEVPNGHGVPVLALTRNEFDTCKRGASRRLDPTYIVDLSRTGSYLLLIFGTLPNRRGVAPDVLRLIVATITWVER